MKISVICPSRLAVNPVSHPQDGKPNLWLDRALCSVSYQAVADVEFEIIVGTDSIFTDAPPQRFSDGGVKFAMGGVGQSRALNAAVRLSTGEVLAFIEDDDVWSNDKIATQLPFLRNYDMVTCNQREIDEYANFIRINDFATPSGWIMRRETFDRVGFFDETFKYHLDTEWLGRANDEKITRCHLVEDGHSPTDWLQNVKRFSDVIETRGITEPLVSRLVNPNGGMSTIAKSATAREISQREHDIMFDRFGMVPW